MSIVALPTSRDSDDIVDQWLGTVVAIDEADVFHVACQDGARRGCKPAASCLLRPAHGDTVLLAGHGRRHLYILAVIEQADPRQSRIAVAGDLEIDTAAGALRLHARDTVTARAAKVQLESEHFSMSAAQANCQVDDATYTGRALKLAVGGLRLVGRVFETIADRVSSISRTSVRVVEDTDTVRAGTLDFKAQASARLHGQHTLVTGQDLVKVDAAQIHVG